MFGYYMRKKNSLFPQKRNKVFAIQYDGTEEQANEIIARLPNSNIYLDIEGVLHLREDKVEKGDYIIGIESLCETIYTLNEVVFEAIYEIDFNDMRNLFSWKVMR